MKMWMGALKLGAPVTKAPYFFPQSFPYPAKTMPCGASGQCAHIW
ncbi:hypothetical protein ALP38_102538 [Pseudomonas amygdali pv. sesami]|nr:hypothetical protein ALO93_102923 [Pseudomonas amygdali pv. sesami]RMT94191.1 hypothetical protein ALP38_102538 [Pseudomonas amygdali pv. sesami]RMU00613.1 hypothetical protein ALP37_102764 [Pseudomonas amygdali pv. sesami]RMV90094.1 hypothetical protein ALP04_103020 [Pseudomonas amygdali pv. sesami]